MIPRAKRNKVMSVDFHLTNNHTCMQEPQTALGKMELFSVFRYLYYGRAARIQGQIPRKRSRFRMTDMKLEGRKELDEPTAKLEEQMKTGALSTI